MHELARTGTMALKCHWVGASALPPLVPWQIVTRGGTWRFPTVFLTNGGGVSEAAKAAQLSALLGVPVSASQVNAAAHAPTKHALVFSTLPHAFSTLLHAFSTLPHIMCVARAVGGPLSYFCKAKG